MYRLFKELLTRSQEKRVHDFRESNDNNGIMIWEAFSSFGRTELVQVMFRLNGKEYVKILEKELLSLADGNFPVEWVYQQDSAPAHASLTARD